MSNDTVPHTREITDYIEGHEGPDGYVPGHFETTVYRVASVLFRGHMLIDGLDTIVEFPGKPGEQIPSAGWISQWIYE